MQLGSDLASDHDILRKADCDAVYHDNNKYRHIAQTYITQMGHVAVIRYHSVHHDIQSFCDLIN